LKKISDYPDKVMNWTKILLGFGLGMGLKAKSTCNWGLLPAMILQNKIAKLNRKFVLNYELFP